MRSFHQVGLKNQNIWNILWNHHLDNHCDTICKAKLGFFEDDASQSVGMLANVASIMHPYSNWFRNNWLNRTYHLIWSCQKNNMSISVSTSPNFPPKNTLPENLNFGPTKNIIQTKIDQQKNIHIPPQWYLVVAALQHPLGHLLQY